MMYNAEDLCHEYWSAQLDYNEPDYEGYSDTPDIDTFEEGGKESVKPSNMNEESDSEYFERLSWLCDVVNDGTLKGEGTGVEIAGVVATCLDNTTNYGFEFSFWRAEDSTE